MSPDFYKEIIQFRWCFLTQNWEKKKITDEKKIWLKFNNNLSWFSIWQLGQFRGFCPLKILVGWQVSKFFFTPKISKSQPYVCVKFGENWLSSFVLSIKKMQTHTGRQFIYIYIFLNLLEIQSYSWFFNR